MLLSIVSVVAVMPSAALVPLACMPGDVCGEAEAAGLIVVIGLFVTMGAAVAVVPLARLDAQPLRTMPAMAMHSRIIKPFFTGFASLPLLCAKVGEFIHTFYQKLFFIERASADKLAQN